MTPLRTALVWSYIALLGAFILAMTYLSHVGWTDMHRGVRPLIDHPWIIAGAMFSVSAYPVHIVTSRGLHTQSLVEVLLVVGLFTHTPDQLIIGCLLGAVPAFMLLKPAPVKLAVNIVHTGFWVAAPTLLFHWAVDVTQSISARQLWAAWLVAVVSWIGSALTIRIPIGIATGTWNTEAGERQALTSAGIATLGTASLAIAGVALASQSYWLPALLVIPLGALASSVQQQRRSAERKRLLDVSLDLNDNLRDDADAIAVLCDRMPKIHEAFDADLGLLLLSTRGAVVRRQSLSEGSDVVTKMPASLPAEAALRSWLLVHGQHGPSIETTPEAREVMKALDVRDLLMIPIQRATGDSILVLGGRRLGPYRSEHVDIARSLAVTAGTAIDRQILARELDVAGKRQVELERRASVEPLTGLANHETFRQAVQRSLDAGVHACVLFIDLNDFKQVNDTLGHAAGDNVIIATADRIRACLRSGDVAGRLGGDEFVVLLPDAPLDVAREVAGRISAELMAPLDILPEVGGIKAAIGISESRAGDNQRTLIERADSAMYEGKNSRSASEINVG